MLEILLTAALSAGLGIWMYKKGYKDGYDTGAVDGFNALKKGEK